MQRPYAPSDGEACLALLDGNTPEYFARSERAEFHDFPRRLPEPANPFFVLARGGAVIGCGGLGLEDGGQSAWLTWGMVERSRHGQGLGTQLVAARLAQARALGLAAVRSATSQHTQDFYARFGLVVMQVTPAGFGPGLDRWDMVLTL